MIASKLSREWNQEIAKNIKFWISHKSHENLDSFTVGKPHTLKMYFWGLEWHACGMASTFPARASLDWKPTFPPRRIRMHSHLWAPMAENCQKCLPCYRYAIRGLRNTFSRCEASPLWIVLGKAQLGLKAPAKARLLGAQASENWGPSFRSKLRLSSGSARAQARAKW